MVDVSTFEDPIDVKLAMLLHLPGRRSRIRLVLILLLCYYSCTRIMRRLCTLVLFVDVCKCVRSNNKLVTITVKFLHYQCAD